MAPCRAATTKASSVRCADTHTLRIPKIYHHGALSGGTFIVMEYLDFGGRGSQGDLGDRLARMHLAPPQVPALGPLPSTVPVSVDAIGHAFRKPAIPRCLTRIGRRACWQTNSGASLLVSRMRVR